MKLRLTLGVFLLGLLAAVAPQTAGKKVILLIGPPGSGKSTQAEKLQDRYRVPIITMSDILRKEGGGKTDLNQRLQVQLASGNLVNDELANQLIAKRIADRDAARGFILDGYPVTAKQADYLDALLTERGLPNVTVIHLDVPDAVATARLQERRRVDDTPEIIQSRIEEYHRESDAILKRYNGPDLLRIDATPSEEVVWESIQKLLGEGK